MNVRVFIDTDVIISSSLSKDGASYHLLQNTMIHRVVSNFSAEESHRTAKKLNISIKVVQEQLDLCASVDVKENLTTITKAYGMYVHDSTDAHVVMGAVRSDSQFIVSYNLKDFKAELIKRELNILILTLGTFLQYLRSKR